MQPYDNSYSGSDISASRVRVGGQLYYLYLDRENLTLQQVSAQEVSPYVYPYSVISEVYPISNEYYEPCIEVNISYEDTQTASMIMVFESEEERNSALSQIQYSRNISPESMPPMPPSEESQYASQSYSGQNMDYDEGYSEQKTGGYGSGGYNGEYDNRKYSDYEKYNNYDDYTSSSSGYDSYDSDYRQTFDEYRYSQGNLSLIEKITGFIRYPGETFESVASDELKQGIIYAGIMLVLFSVVSVFLSSLIASAVAPESTIYGTLLTSIPELIRLILEYLIFGILCTVVYGLLVFLLTKITGQGIELSESLLTTFYSTTAFGTIGLIPLFGIFIAPFWMIFLQIKGLCNGYDADVKFAALSAVIPAVLMFAIFYYIVVSGEVAFI